MLDVVVFFLRLPQPHGGYVGVAVFFSVMSGFLITAHLVREVN